MAKKKKPSGISSALEDFSRQVTIWSGSSWAFLIALGNIAYESDLGFVAKTMQEVAEEEVGESMKRRVRVYRRLLSKTPIDELEVKEHPSVIFRASENTWLEAIVRYLAHPRTAGRVKTRLIKKLLAKLNAAPDRVLFPKGSTR